MVLIMYLVTRSVTNYKGLLEVKLWDLVMHVCIFLMMSFSKLDHTWLSLDDIVLGTFLWRLNNIHNENFQLKIHIQVKSWFEDFVIKNIMVQQFFIGWLVWKICYFYLHVDFKDFPFKRKIFRFLGCVPSHYFSLEWHIMSIVCKRKKLFLFCQIVP